MEEKTPWTSIDLYYKGVHIKKSLPDNVKIEELIRTVDTYLEAGFKPSWNEGTNNGHKEPQTAVVTPQVGSQNPICRIHGTPMDWKTGISKKTNKPYAFWSCSSKNADGSYCSFKPTV